MALEFQLLALLRVLVATMRLSSSVRDTTRSGATPLLPLRFSAEITVSAIPCGSASKPSTNARTLSRVAIIVVFMRLRCGLEGSVGL
ncbi:MAG: hypothetical protein IPM89_12635 [Candidatus Competibacteraceae bacterium]|nr:MAG: hypothetical protein IPM89_12635 [Candidatus Competibacteraceae bacterium]